MNTSHVWKPLFVATGYALIVLDIRALINFFFQAEDGIRDFHVTGVQTCALPISTSLNVPISRIREVTVASMMFMMPMPLTSRVTIEIRSRTQVRPVAMRSAMESSAVRLETS